MLKPKQYKNANIADCLKKYLETHKTKQIIWRNKWRNIWRSIFDEVERLGLWHRKPSQSCFRFNQLVSVSTLYQGTIWISLHYTAGSIQVRGLLKPKICGLNFLSIVLNYISPEKLTQKAIWHLTIWQNWCFDQFYDSKIEKEKELF